MRLEQSHGRQAQDTKHKDLNSVPMAVNGRRTVLVALFPDSSDVSGSGTRITAYQISRANRATQIGGFGKVSTLIPGGENSAVPAGGGSTPSGIFLSVSNQGQGVLGVNQLNCIPGDVVRSKDIYDSHPTLVNFDSGNPIETGYQGNHESNWWNADCKRPKTIGEPNPAQGYGQDKGNQQSDYLTESGFEDLHHTNLSLGATA